MDLIKKINRCQKTIFSNVCSFLNEKKEIFTDYKKETAKYLNMLSDFIENGKGLRGSLAIISNEIFENNVNIKRKTVVELASFFEIIHSSLLIHDDIMDNDERRRNKLTIHRQFQLIFKDKILPKKNYLGHSLGINLGDIGFFIAFKILNMINIEEKTRLILCDFIQNELIKVGLAQMDDVIFSQTKEEPSLDKILKIYLFKTGRYTFVMPVISILIIKNYPLEIVKSVERILEYLGIIFQITDDQIGLLSSKTGKDIGSDIRENKKTVIRYFIFNNKKIPDNIKIIFGQKITAFNLKQIQEIYFKYRIDQKIKNLIDEQKSKITQIVNENKEIIPKKFQDFVFDVVDYLIHRNK